MSSTQQGRYRRLSNTTDLRSETIHVDLQASNTFKLPALNAISKSVKYNDLAFATIQDLHKLRREPNAVLDLEESAAHQSLMAVRRRYDSITQVREDQERQIDKLRIEKERFTIEGKEYADHKAEGRKRVEQLQRMLEEIRLHLEEVEMEKKVVAGMSWRLKEDRIVYDQRREDLQREHSFLRKQLAIFHQEDEGSREEEDRCRKVYSKLVAHWEEEARERQTHIRSMQRMINEKQAVNNGSIMRSSEMQEIAETAQLSKDATEIGWQKVFIANVFLKRLLRDKMASEMHKFEAVEQAYKHIKTVTGVQTGEALISKFLNKEAVYGELLGQIAENERQMSQLKAENDRLLRERTQVEAERDALSMGRREGIHLTNEEKILHEMSQKAERCELHAEKLKDWLRKNERQFSHLLSKKERREKEKEREEGLKQLFKAYADRMVRTVEEAQQTSADPNLEMEGEEMLSLTSNLRIKVGEEQEQQPKPKKNPQKQYDESEHVDQQRAEMLKNNDKFMKEARKKYEETRKGRIDAEPKKKQTSPEKKPADKT